MPGPQSYLTLPLALEARNLTTSYLLEAAAWWRGVQPSLSRARMSSGSGSSSESREVLPLVAARCRRVLNRSFLFESNGSRVDHENKVGVG